MIIKKELRSGNLVMLPHEPNKPVYPILEIRELGIIFGKSYETGTGYCEFKVADPIPFTPEWLLSLGFEKTTALVERYEIPFKDGAHIFMNEGETVIKIEIEYIPIELENIKYVHQVQNLYLDLTGSELAITPLP